MKAIHVTHLPEPRPRNHPGWEVVIEHRSVTGRQTVDSKHHTKQDAMPHAKQPARKHQVPLFVNGQQIGGVVQKDDWHGSEYQIDPEFDFR